MVELFNFWYIFFILLIVGAIIGLYFLLRNRAEKTKKIVDRYFDVIVGPVLTEKTMNLTQTQNKVTIKVNAKSSKEEIKDAFEAIFGVKVAQVNVINVRAKSKRLGRYEGKVSGYKKAIVKLAEGQSLDLYSEASE